MNQQSEAAPGQAVRHEGQRFVTTSDGVQAYLEYHREGDQMVISETLVPDEIGGRGIAGQLTRAAFEHARAEGWKVRPVCSYAAAWVQRHPEYGPLLG